MQEAARGKFRSEQVAELPPCYPRAETCNRYNSINSIKQMTKDETQKEKCG